MELRGYATSLAAIFIVSLACPTRYEFCLPLSARLDSLKRRMTEAGTIPSVSFCIFTCLFSVLGRLVGQFTACLFSAPLLPVTGLFLFGYVASDVKVIFTFSLVELGLFSVIVVVGLLGKVVLGMLSNCTGRAVIMTLSGFPPWVSGRGYLLFSGRDRDKKEKDACRCLISGACEKKLPAELLNSVMQGKAMINSQYNRAA